MAWPTPQDYNEAVQNPKHAFADPELQMGRPELTPLDLPRPITGGFASVYRLQCAQRNWAVRCFLRQFHDHAKRYDAISDHLARVRLPYTVGFTFLRNGIRVGGQWYPILKMEWVQGEPLNSFIEKHLGNPNSLLSLASRWVEMMRALQKASIAHGDLQHGNVFVVDGDLRLIDYDGMYVPNLCGEASHELGHRNYQHPRRTESNFDPHLDNFSAWVIYVSLIALAVDSQLWQRFGGGDESLLFRRKDFEQPEDSDVFNALERHRDERIQSAATFFKSLLYLEPQQVCYLDGQIATTTFPPEEVHRADSSWIGDHVKRVGADAPAPLIAKRSSVALEPPLPPCPDPSWILDFLAPSAGAGGGVSFKNSAAPERVVLAVSAAMSAVFVWMAPLIVAASGSWLLGILHLVLFNLALWICRYRSDPSVRQFALLSSRLIAINDNIRAMERDIAAADRKKTELRNGNAAEQATIANEQKAVEAKEKKELDERQSAHQSVFSSINNRRQALNQQEVDALRKIQNDIGTKVVALNRQIAALTQGEATDLANTLRAQQEHHITAHLRRFSLEDAFITGVGPIFKSRLRIAGFHTAADVDVYRVQIVQGIGPQRAASLTAWRKSIESRARATMPQSLSQSNTAAIRAKYESQRQALEGERDREQRRQRDEENAVRAQCRRLLEEVDKEERAANTKIKGEIDEIRARYAQQYRFFRESLSSVADETASKLCEIDGRITEARKELFGLHWEMAKLRRQLKSFEGIKFPKYVKRVFFGLRAA
ncbi:MAG: hypothetical protein HY717_02980 [Planctomycetes bacterium]|nr:hypothetical protein [Planctomycetota bacterium]